MITLIALFRVIEQLDVTAAALAAAALAAAAKAAQEAAWATLRAWNEESYNKRKEETEK